MCAFSQFEQKAGNSVDFDTYRIDRQIYGEIHRNCVKHNYQKLIGQLLCVCVADVDAIIYS